MVPVSTPRRIDRADRRHPLAWLVVASLLALAVPVASATKVQALVVPSPLPEEAIGARADRGAAGGVPPRSLPAPPTHLPAGLLGGGAHPTGDVPKPPQPHWQALGAALLPGGTWPQVAALARVSFAPGAVLTLDRPAGTLLLAVDSGALAVTLAARPRRPAGRSHRGSPPSSRWAIG